MLLLTLTLHFNMCKGQREKMSGRIATALNIIINPSFIVIGHRVVAVSMGIGLFKGETRRSPSLQLELTLHTFSNG